MKSNNRSIIMAMLIVVPAALVSCATAAHNAAIRDNNKREKKALRYTTSTALKVVTQAQNNDDASLCDRQSDCASCRNAIMSNGSPCTWYSDFGYCDTYELGILFVGDDTCTDVTCEGCLQAGGAWTKMGSCHQSCHGHKEGSECATLDTVSSSSSSISDTCQMLNTKFEDFKKCLEGDNTDCETCTGATLSEGSCYWNEDYKVCDSDSLFGYGVTTCSN